MSDDIKNIPEMLRMEPDRYGDQSELHWVAADEIEFLRAKVAELEASNASLNGIVVAEIDRNDELRAKVAELEAPCENFEDELEKAFWTFDAKHKGYGEWKHRPQSECDAFKNTVRGVLNRWYVEQGKEADQLREQLTALKQQQTVETVGRMMK